MIITSIAYGNVYEKVSKIKDQLRYKDGKKTL